GDTLHPIHEGRVFRWERGGAETTLLEYGRTTEGSAAEAWRRSPFFRLVHSSEAMLRLPVTEATAEEFPSIHDFRSLGMTDYVALINRFGADKIIGEMDCILSSWVT